MEVNLTNSSVHLNFRTKDSSCQGGDFVLRNIPDIWRRYSANLSCPQTITGQG